jgi:hypothetical protein
MNDDSEIREALHESFRAALILTGSDQGAAQAVTSAIPMLGPDGALQDLPRETARAAVADRAFEGESFAALPLELRALSLLLPLRRNAFVLRILMRLDLETCADILKAPRMKVEEAVCQSLFDLSQMVQLLGPKVPTAA